MPEEAVDVIGAELADAVAVQSSSRSGTLAESGACPLGGKPITIAMRRHVQPPNRVMMK